MDAARGSERDVVDYLIRDGTLSSADRDEVERLAVLWDAGPIDVVLAKGLAPAHEVAAAIAACSGVSRLDTRATPLDARLAERRDLTHYLQAQALPWGMSDGAPLFAVVNPYQAQSDIPARLGIKSHFDVAVLTSAELIQAVLEVFGATIVEEAIYGLSDRTPEMSARRGITWPQATILVATAAATAFAFVRAPATAFTIASLAAGAFFIATMAFRLVLTLVSLVGSQKPARIQTIDPARLPFYTILVALRDESALLPQIIEALSAIDYPATKLEVLLLLEQSDDRTKAAARALPIDGRFRIITVADRLPRTKPKACNFGLALARGDYVVIYDAEDRPDPKQLMRALDVFAAAPQTACVQSRLSFYNASENWLTRQFAIEFSLWFCFLLPGLARLRLPIPLGGTSNHFRRAALEGAGGWDAFNVTEDADIGIRIARLGGQVRTITSDTAEEANCELGNWLHQRSRWLKGYLQTWLVHMRDPARLWREVGLFGFCSFQLLIGGAVLSAFLHLIFWSLLIARLCGVDLPNLQMSAALWPWTLAVLIFGNGVAILSGVIAALHPQLKGQGRAALALNAFSMPIYWFLISFAAIKAVISFASRPFYWAKTRHGISRLTRGKRQD